MLQAVMKEMKVHCICYNQRCKRSDCIDYVTFTEAGYGSGNWSGEQDIVLLHLAETI